MKLSETEFQVKVGPSLLCGKQMGNVYCGSVYASLISLICTLTNAELVTFYPSLVMVGGRLEKELEYLAMDQALVARYLCYLLNQMPWLLWIALEIPLICMGNSMNVLKLLRLVMRRYHTSRAYFQYLLRLLGDG